MSDIDFEPLKRIPFFPVCSNGDGQLADSKFSGIPWLGDGESWPKCKNCKNAMQLFIQLNLSSIPKESGITGSGIVQLFYCTNKQPDCEVDCESWEWNDKTMLVRTVTANGLSGSPKQTPVVGAFPAKAITRWEPGDAELPAIIEVSDYVEISVDELDDLEVDDHYTAPSSGDKLGGWPEWVQGIEYRNCKQCDQAMKLVFQLDSNVNVPYMWGDAGCSYITQCPTHPEVVSFGWACM